MEHIKLKTGHAKINESKIRNMLTLKKKPGVKNKEDVKENLNTLDEIIVMSWNKLALSLAVKKQQLQET